MRFDNDGQELPDFVLNRSPWRSASILIALDNFGYGSSREYAPWALIDFGISCIIAAPFADIFYNNCFKNGILPIRLGKSTVAVLIEDAVNADRATLSIDLPAQTILRSSEELISFDLEAG